MRLRSNFLRLARFSWSSKISNFVFRIIVHQSCASFVRVGLAFGF